MRAERDAAVAELPPEIAAVLPRRLAEHLRVVVLESLWVFRADEDAAELEVVELHVLLSPFRAAMGCNVRAPDGEFGRTDANLYENVVRHRLAARFRSVDPLAGDARSHRCPGRGGRLRARAGRDPGLGPAPALAAGGRRQVGRWRGDPRLNVDEL